MKDTIIEELEHQLRLKDFKLNSLLEITNGINTNESVEQLTSIYQFILKEQLGFEKFILFNKQEKWDYLIKTGVKGKVRNLDVERDLLRFKEITVIESSHLDALNEFDVVIPVYHKEKPLAFLLIKGIEEKGKDLKLKSSLDNLTFIQTLTNIIVVAIENKRMARQGLKQERIKKELEVASEMQKLLFPDDLPSDRRLDLAATYKARHEVGGDYYDFIPLNDDEFIVCIADVSGKGISAAMLMANFQATIRTLLNYQRFELDFLVEELNKKVMRTAKGEKFITFFIGQYNSKTRLFKYVNAGHNYPILTNGREARFLDKGSIGLGMLDEIPFIEPDEVSIPPNSTIVLYTDGVVELQNKEGEYFETDRLIKLVHSFYPLKMEDLNNLIFSKLDEFRGTQQLVDDTAIFSCRIF
ncbi:MAG: PP2C family protein-serine/threonine phosphatase [Brumimicrobium sp.]|nr:PP2C family protein-serine/threonine phosphatase [Brumimicrobium sp.]